MPQARDKYSDPELRDRIKDELMQSDKGGQPGQWSARKAQMMASEYKKRGGGYTDDKKDERAKHLDQWTKEDWQTSDGKGAARNEDGTEERYLPKKAWEKMSEEEKKETNEKKRQGSRKGQQFVGNTEKAKDSRKEAQEEDDSGDGDEDEKEEGKGKKTQTKGRTSQQKGGDKSQNEESSNGLRRSSRKRNSSSAKGDKQGDDDEEEEQIDEEPAQKRQRQKQSTSDAKNTPKKQSGTHGSKHDSHEAPAKQASKDRLPKKGQTCHWKAMPGWVEGHVEEVLTKAKTVNGKSVKASKDDPRIVLRSHGPSGKLAVHKPEVCYFDD